MDRLQILRAGIDRHHEILEIAPYFRPIAARCDGYRVTTLDIFDTAELRRRATADASLGPADVAAIEEVDLIGSACDVADVVASHREKILDPELTAIMDEIDLRAQVELAKMRLSLDRRGS
jgi:hypothetical protein